MLSCRQMKSRLVGQKHLIILKLKFGLTVQSENDENRYSGYLFLNIAITEILV